MVSDNILKIRQRVAAAGGDPGKIALVAVTKGRDIEAIKEAIAAGIMDIGENRVQEAKAKFEEFCNLGPSICGLKSDMRGFRWHFIGHLQTNKVKEAVRIFDLIQSVDSPHLAREIDKEAARAGKIQNVLVEIKTSGEETKSGLAPEDAVDTIAQIRGMKNISIKGLMTIAPAVNDPESAGPYFKELRLLRNRLCELWYIDCLTWILSMGMSDDFEAAVKEGATMLRVGRAIFD